MLHLTNYPSPDYTTHAPLKHKQHRKGGLQTVSEI